MPTNNRTPGFDHPLGPPPTPPGPQVGSRNPPSDSRAGAPSPVKRASTLRRRHRRRNASVVLVAALLAAVVVVGGVLLGLAMTGGNSHEVRSSATMGASRVVAPNVLTARSYMQSLSGEYRLLMQSDGNLVLYHGATNNQPLWSSATFNHPGAYATIQTDGNLVVFSSTNTPLWNSGTGGHGAAAYSLQLQDDSNLVVYAPGGGSLWSTGLHANALSAPGRLNAGNYLSSPGAQYRLLMQPDGNLVLYHGATNIQPLWSSATFNHPGAYATIQTDGNFVVYSSTGTPLWNSRTGGKPAAAYSIILQSNGNAALYSEASGQQLWNASTLQIGRP